MNFPRRRFLGSSLLVFGSTLLEALATPLWKWNSPVALQAAVCYRGRPCNSSTSRTRRALILPTSGAIRITSATSSRPKGSGIAFFDYDNDGWLDIYLTNGTRLGKLASGSSTHLASLQEQSRRHVHRYNREIGTGSHGLANGSLRRRLRQRWLGRSVLLFLGT